MIVDFLVFTVVVGIIGVALHFTRRAPWSYVVVVDVNVNGNVVGYLSDFYGYRKIRELPQLELDRVIYFMGRERKAFKDHPVVYRGLAIESVVRSYKDSLSSGFQAKFNERLTEATERMERVRQNVQDGNLTRADAVNAVYYHNEPQVAQIADSETETGIVSSDVNTDNIIVDSEVEPKTDETDSETTEA